MNASISNNSAIVLLSGGLDSTVALADTLSRKPVALVLTFDYGQRAAKQELRAACGIAAHYGLLHEIVTLPWLSELLPQALMPTETLTAQGLAEKQNLSDAELFDVNRVWVPNRNGLFLNIAACFAEARKISWLVFGANAEEGADFPDNTPAFRDKLNEVLAFSTLSGVRLETPMGHLDKAAIIQRGIELNVPFELIWSCYEAGETQCSRCPSCLRVKAAREQVCAKTGHRVAIDFQTA